MELGTVRVRVGLSYDPLRLSPSSGDLYYRKLRGPFLLKENASHPTPTKNNNQPNTKQKKYYYTYNTKAILINTMDYLHSGVFA